MMIPAPVQEGVVVGGILLSACTYLFDFASNLVVVAQYFARYLHASSHCGGTCPPENSYLAGYFYALLVVLLFSHSLNALLFKLKFKQHHAPVYAAYFLPLIHLRALFRLFSQTLGFKGVQDLRSSEMNGLYSILGAALEGIPMLNLQLAAFMVLSKYDVITEGMSTTFKVSVVAALLSAAYNGGAAVQSVAKNARSLKDDVMVGAVAGGFTLCATILRSLTIIKILDVFVFMSFDDISFLVSLIVFLIVWAFSITAYCLYYWLLYCPANFFKNLRNPRHLLVSLVLSYMSVIMGPLYPMVSLANDMKQLGRCVFRLKLCAVALLHLPLDIFAFFFVLPLPQPFLYVFLPAVIFYLVFLCAYIILDVYCGPTNSSAQEGEVQPAESTEHVEHLMLEVSSTKTSTILQRAGNERPLGFSDKQAAFGKYVSDFTSQLFWK